MRVPWVPSQTFIVRLFPLPSLHIRVSTDYGWRMLTSIRPTPPRRPLQLSAITCHLLLMYCHQNIATTVQINQARTKNSTSRQTRDRRRRQIDARGRR
ncbi:hypothetical protein Zmor_002978 [Zophobas morio]|uniref:Uncharacterized protein n=1 Tax=Zophobas morio TaxID=2755281 RepID=A0AA38HLJ2_9CUCU|nr:hypothetical protein Zmor_002978 [Zophobas morio]